MSTAGRIAAWTLTILILAAAVTAAFVYIPRWYAESLQVSTTPEPVAAPATPKIKASLFYLSEDGLRLVAVEREVAFAEGTVQQARRLVEAQLEAPARPLASAIPEGVRLRALYVDERGQAFVDVSREISTAHSGGALGEILTVYSIVNVLTTNLAAVRAVQILVDGHEVDTLAGHVDLRRPLARGSAWVEDASAPAAPAPPAAPPAADTTTPPPTDATTTPAAPLRDTPIKK
jgi:spore germination protein GerM